MCDHLLFIGYVARLLGLEIVCKFVRFLLGQVSILCVIQSLLIHLYLPLTDVYADKDQFEFFVGFLFELVSSNPG